MDIWDLFDQTEIDPSAGASDAARRDTSHTADRLQLEVLRLERKIDGLALVSQALWELVRQETGLKDTDIARKIEEVDLRDGRRDGRLLPQPVSCTKCGRPTPARQRTCMYCGAPVGQSDPPAASPKR
jgi:predicted Zn-ribbon and HTH transcriptional regulator